MQRQELMQRREPMRRLFAAVLLLPLPLPVLAQGPQLVDRIVAVVSKEVITFSELGAAVASAERQLRRQGTAVPERAVLERQILERLILDKAQLQRARDTGIRIDELQLDRAVQRIAENNKMTLPDFRRALERDRVPFNAWREELREQIMLSRLRERDVDDKIQVNDSEIDLFLAAQRRTPSAPNTTSRISWCGFPSRRRRSASKRRAPGRRRRWPKRAPEAISPTSRRPIPMPRTRCRAATSGGAGTSGCRSSSPLRSRR
jgi:hypothetical protein